MTNANGNGVQKVTSLRDLPQSIQPPHDLWADIEAHINARRDAVAAGADADPIARHAIPRWVAAAATIAALAVGVWIGREVLPTQRAATQPIAQSATNAGPRVAPVNEGAKALQAAYMSDPKYRRERAALVKSLEAKLASLPPDTRAKVIASLATLHKSMQDLEAALGKDPTNALLQELLLDTYQDEMRVLTTVQDASDAGKGV